jgi:hypothetical protein
MPFEVSITIMAVSTGNMALNNFIGTKLGVFPFACV